jgi:hypothetical protein
MDDNKVVILIEDSRAQFRTFGEGLQLLNDKVDRVEIKVDKLEQKLDTHIEENRRDFEANRREHQQLMQMVKELDKEVQVEIKRVK